MVINFLFHGNLQELVKAKPDSKGVVRHTIERRASIKDVIESLGIPHTEIQQLQVNGRNVTFEYILEDYDEVEAVPLTPPQNLCKPSLLRPAPLDDLRFIIDINVGKLATLLRMAGFDTAYPRDVSGSELAALSQRDKRILLTRDLGLLKRKIVEHGHLVREHEPAKQLQEIITLYGLDKKIQPFTRCLCCNTRLVPVRKKDILHRLLPLTKKYFHTFHHCTRCDKIFWPGSHRVNMEKYLRM